MPGTSRTEAIISAGPEEVSGPVFVRFDSRLSHSRIQAHMTTANVSLEDLRINPDDRPGEGRRRWRWLWVALSAVVLFLLAGAILRPKTPMVEAGVVDKVEDAGGPRAVLQASGYVTARRKATVSSKVTGKVTEILVEEGMKLTEGQIVARLDDSLLRRQVDLDRARLQAAKSQLNELNVRLAEAELNLKRSRELVGSGVSAQAQLDADQARVDSIRAQLDSTRESIRVSESEGRFTEQQLDDLVIRAPFSGVAISKDAQPGEMISPVSAGGGFTRTGICTLVDMSSLEIEVDVNESYINRVKDEQRVTAILDSYPDWEIPGHVITTVPTADRDKATVKVRIAFDHLDPRILPDMGVKVAFLTDDPNAELPVATVPQGAIVRDGDTTSVFLLLDGDVVERREIRLGANEAGTVEVMSGLAGGERVVLSPPKELESGKKVRLKAQKAANPEKS